MKKKSILTILLTLVLCFALTSCGGNMEVDNALNGKTFYCKGDTENSTYMITFQDGKADLLEQYSDGNGVHDGATDSVSYKADEENITISWSEIDEMVIPYTLDGENIKIGNGEFKTLAEVEKGIQGIWKYRSYSFGTHEHNLKVTDGKAVYQKAVDSDYSFFWYGPYNCTYTIEGCKIVLAGDDTETFMVKINDKNKVRIMHYTNEFSKTKKFPEDPENDYNF